MPKKNLGVLELGWTVLGLHKKMMKSIGIHRKNGRGFLLYIDYRFADCAFSPSGTVPQCHRNHEGR